MYTASSKNKKSVTIFESINAAGNHTPSPIVVIKRFDMMVNWFPEGLSVYTHIMPSEKRFTTDHITLEYL